LKYANPVDLPSYPSRGGVQLSSAGAAASIAHANQRSFEQWKPGEIPGANKAAFHAKDYQAPPLWQPEMSAAGSKAALQAVRDGANVNIWKPDETEHGPQAAGHAMRRTDLSPNVQRGVTADGGHRAKLAATGAMSLNRRRAESSPAYPPTFSTSPPGAARAATTPQGGSRRGQNPIEISDPALDHSRIHNIAKSNVSRQLYTANPPVAIEVEEKNRQDTLHASAVAMAKQMYKMQQTRIEEAAASNRTDSHSHYAANKVHARRVSTASASTTDDLPSPPLYTNLQEAAQKLATERLAKLHDEHQAYRNYYGQTSPPKKRLSIRPKARRRASSDGDAAKLDEEQSQKIRSEMSLFQDKLAAVDAKKRQRDRDALMAAAQRNVTARMSTMDEKVFEDTGKASPAMVAEWEAAAQARAQADSDARMVNHGKIHIGSGKYLDQADVEAIARGRLQPTLDDITEKAERQRAKDEEMRLEEEERKRQAELEKVRSAELKAEQRKARGKLDSTHPCSLLIFVEAEKGEEKARKDFERSQQAEEKRTQKEAEREEKRAQKETAREEKRKSKEAANQAADKDDKRKGGFFGALSLGTGIGAGAAPGAGGATVAAVPQTLDPIPKSDPTATEKDDTGGNPEAKSKGKEEDADKDTAHDTTKTETAQEEPARPVAKAEETSSPPLPTVTTTGTGDSATSPTNEEGPASPTKSGVKGWLKGKFARRSSRSTKEEAGFTGGTMLTGTDSKDEDGKASPSSPPALIPEEDSMKEVAMAGKLLTVQAPDAVMNSASEYGDIAAGPSGEGTKRSPSISSISSEGVADNNKDRASPIDVSEPTSPVQTAVSTTLPESPTSPTKPRGRDRIAGFLSKGRGLGRKLSKRQKESSTTDAPSEITPEIGAPTEEAASGAPLNKAYSDALEKKATEESAQNATKTKSKEENQAEVEEARDTFDSGEELSPPPKLTDMISDHGSGLGRKPSGSPVRDSRFSEDL
jgi:hypothetical protein